MRLTGVEPDSFCHVRKRLMSPPWEADARRVLQALYWADVLSTRRMEVRARAPAPHTAMREHRRQGITEVSWRAQDRHVAGYIGVVCSKGSLRTVISPIEWFSTDGHDLPWQLRDRQGNKDKTRVERGWKGTSRKKEDIPKVVLNVQLSRSTGSSYPTSESLVCCGVRLNECADSSGEIMDNCCTIAMSANYEGARPGHHSPAWPCRSDVPMSGGIASWGELGRGSSGGVWWWLTKESSGVTESHRPGSSLPSDCLRYLSPAASPDGHSNSVPTESNVGCIQAASRNQQLRAHVLAGNLEAVRTRLKPPDCLGHLQRLETGFKPPRQRLGTG
ncbi:hypothetical protein DFH06DRAFT_1141303 [Mycena polygramma]|nr:hypothetical protein DFH06DRAFT_1141303 [Mycena polygramma]